MLTLLSALVVTLVGAGAAEALRRMFQRQVRAELRTRAARQQPGEFADYTPAVSSTPVASAAEVEPIAQARPAQTG